MVNYIKWIVTILGFARGGVIGGFIGLAIGTFIEEYINDNISIGAKKIFKGSEIEYTDYQKRLLALISEVVKADGYINKEEIYFIKSYLLRQFGSIYCNIMLKTLKLEVDKNYDIESIVKGLKNTINNHSKIQLLTFLYGITLQNGSISTKESILIENIAKIIGLTKEEYYRITNRSKKENQKQKQTHTQRTYGYNPYKILGISESASDKEVKKAYRKMVLKFHPDRTDEEDEIANEKFNAISEAYHTIKKRRNIK